MSRNGRIPINIPEDTQVRVENGVIFAKGKLGELSFSFNKDAKVEVSEKNIMVNKGVKPDITNRCGEQSELEYIT